MNTNYSTVSPDTTYRQVAVLLHSNQLTGVPVVNDQGSLVGIISEKDLFRVLYPWYSSFYESPESYTDFELRESKITEIQDYPVSKFLKERPVTVYPDEPIMHVGGLMLARGVHIIPVVDRQTHELIGICNRMDIYRSILEHHLEL